LLAKSNGIIFATPVYNGGVSAQLKTVMDRTRSLVAADKNFFILKTPLFFQAKLCGVWPRQYI
jgi:multimeric flavodoxin WrbA